MEHVPLPVSLTMNTVGASYSCQDVIPHLHWALLVRRPLKKYGNDFQKLLTYYNSWWNYRCWHVRIWKICDSVVLSKVTIHWCKWSQKINIPPSRAALQQHEKHAAYQAGYVWVQTLKTNLTLPSGGGKKSVGEIWCLCGGPCQKHQKAADKLSSVQFTGRCQYASKPPMYTAMLF